jgi:hypothetical protein
MAGMTERDILRPLAARVREIAELPVMRERRELWARHNALQNTQPLVLCFPEGAWTEILPEDTLQCATPPFRQWERVLRSKIWWWEQIADDNFIEPWFDVNWQLRIGDYGFAIPYHHGDDRGSYVWDAPIKDLAADLPKLKPRTFEVDRAGTERLRQLAHDTFGDLLPVRIHGSLWWTVGLTWEAAKLVGLENLMFYMCDQPERVHQLMRFLSDDHLRFITWCEKEGLLTPNNSADYVGSGGVGCTDELPASGRLADRWGFAESQETVGISPAMFEEFVLPYQVPLLEKFGLNCYGCCEGLETRIDAVLRNVPRLRRVSVAPTANQEVLAGTLAGKFVFSRKPYPAHVCVGFNEPAIRADLRHTLSVARGQPLELILKDTHTLEQQPERIARWVKIAREEIAK